WQEVQHSGWTFWPRPSGLAELSDLCVGSPHRAIGTPSDRRLDLEKLCKPEATEDLIRGSLKLTCGLIIAGLST
ncbi:hypothetical protein QWI17_05020, partial [Gilvimarinus sp. SDUM040013]|uniref:hypothetical protein n=1 Tax=Gilvimarinus gilvus TaxID=3058038 RepID=UPI00267275E4